MIYIKAESFYNRPTNQPVIFANQRDKIKEKEKKYEESATLFRYTSLTLFTVCSIPAKVRTLHIFLFFPKHTGSHANMTELNLFKCSDEIKKKKTLLRGLSLKSRIYIVVRPQVLKTFSCSCGPITMASRHSGVLMCA